MGGPSLGPSLGHGQRRSTRAAAIRGRLLFSRSLVVFAVACCFRGRSLFSRSLVVFAVACCFRGRLLFSRSLVVFAVACCFCLGPSLGHGQRRSSRAAANGKSKNPS